MWTFLGRPECILCLSSALSTVALLSYNKSPRLNQSHLTPLLMVRRDVGLKVEGSQFTLGGSPFRIISGTMDYFRIPRVYWKSSLKKMQACGFNTLTIHVPWNIHEPEMGQFHFAESTDIGAFITMASAAGLWVILCPGPYIGSGLDLGGLPSWLLRDPKMKLRTTYKGFTRAMNRYFDHLIPMVAQLQVKINPQFKRGGPIIAVQVENEYGSYHMDKRYMAYVKTGLLSRGISELLMTADDGLNVRKGHLRKVLATVHMKNIRRKTYDDLKSIQGGSPILMMVYTAKSFDTWGHFMQVGDAHMLMKDVHEMFSLGFSLNFYMFQGGTNFGFIGGAESSNGYLSSVTSYDYRALLTENGQYTPEYKAFQEYFHAVTDIPKSIQPAAIQAVVYKSLTFLEFMTLWEVLPYLNQPITSVKPLSMEQLPVNNGAGQSYGYILYETNIFVGGLLTSKGHVQDRGQVFLDNGYIGVLDRSKEKLSIVKNPSKEAQTLRILVENQGRLTSGQNINKERKGLIGDLYLDQIPLRHYKIYSLEMKNISTLQKLPNSWKTVKKHVQGPAFFLSHLKVGVTPQDTFIDVKGWGKGIVFINGQNTGRYWNIGPQESLYVPAPWLHPGVNEIILFEELEGDLKIQFTKEPQLGLAIKLETL